MTKIRLGDEVFHYQVFYKKNQKNMYLRIKDDVITITSPKSFSKKEIETFIIQNEDRVLERVDTLRKRIPLYNDSKMLLFGNQIDISYTINNTRNSYYIHENYIEINFTKNYFDTKYIEKIYRELMLITVDEILESETANLSRYFNLNNITYKAQLMKSRFGSCNSRDKIIKLNSFLARLPIIYIRTILIHEVIHLRVHNHQKEFYKYIDMFIPNYKKIVDNLNNEYRKYVI